MNEQQEREAFEKWFSTQPDAQGFSYGQHVARPDGTYEWPYKQELWECWKARASQPVPSGLTDEQIAHLAAAHTNSIVEFDRMLKFARALLAAARVAATERQS